MQYFIIALRIPGKFGVREFVMKSKNIAKAMATIGESFPLTMPTVQVELKRITQAYFMQMLKSGMKEM